MKYTIKNIKQFITKHTFIFILFLLCQTVSVLVLAFSVGVFQNYNQIKKEEDIDNRFLDISFVEYVNLGEIKKVFDLLTPNDYTPIESLFIGSTEEESSISFNLEYDQNIGRIIYKKSIWESAEQQGMLLFGRFMSLKEYMDGEKLAIVSYNVGKEEDTINLLGEDYKIIGVRKEEADPGGIVLISYYAAPDELPSSVVGITYRDLPTRLQYERIKDVFTSVFGDKAIFPDFEVADMEEQYFYNTILLASVVVGALTAIYLSILFHYLLGFRRKTLAILRMYGCTKIKARRFYITEIFIISIPLFALCMLGYHVLILPWLSTIFPYILPIYTVKAYFIMFVIYIGIVYMVLNFMISLYIHRMPVKLLKEG